MRRTTSIRIPSPAVLPRLCHCLSERCSPTRLRYRVGMGDDEPYPMTADYVPNIRPNFPWCTQ